MTLRTRASIGLGILAIGAGGMVAASPVVATQAATQTQINGIVSATNAWTNQTQGYTYADYSVQGIAVSSVDPSFARAQIVPTAKYRGVIPQQWVVLTGSGSLWTVVDGGVNFCDNVASIPASVIADLFPGGARCQPTSNKYTMAQVSNGGYRLVVSAQRKGTKASVFVSLQTTGGTKVTERRVGATNGFTWSTVTRPGSAYATLNMMNQWGSVQVLRSASALYAVYGFRASVFGLSPTNLS